MYRDDAEAARLRITALEDQLAAARRENEALRQGRPPSRSGPVIAVVVSVVLAIGGTVAWASAASRSGGPRLRPREAERAAQPTTTSTAMTSTSPEMSALETASTPLTVDPPAEPSPDPIARALEPAHPDVIEVLASREHGRDLFVLHRWLGARAWRHARQEAGTLEQELEDYEDRRTICEDGAFDDAGMERCALEEAPDRWVGAEDAICERAHAIEVAHLVREGERLEVRARRRLIDVACDAAGAERAPELRAADVDRDGRVELTAIAPFVVPSVLMDQYESATIGAVLDAGDLHPQLVALRDYDASYGDESSITRTVATTWSLDDADGDGVIEAHLRQRVADVDDSDRSTSAPEADCPYDTARDRWTCRDAWAVDPLRAAIGGTDLGDLAILR